MKEIQNTFKYLATFAITVFAIGCGNLQEKENLAAAAGFKVITPSTANQTARLKKLPKDKVTRVVQQGRTYYVLPDAAHNQAYVGGPKQYKAYQQLRLAKQISNDNLEAAQMNEMTAENWGMWGGWGMGGMGWY